MKTGRRTISLQKVKEGWLLSFSSGTALCKIYTNTDVEPISFEASNISSTNYGYKAEVNTTERPHSEEGYDAILIKGNWSKIEIDNPAGETDFYYKDKKVSTGRSHTYEMEISEKITQVNWLPLLLGGALAFGLLKK